MLPPPKKKLMLTQKLAKLWMSTYCLGLYIVNYNAMGYLKEIFQHGAVTDTAKFFKFRN
jgi:hypothetical protein